MITIRLMGGLGNSLFQYAVGRSLSLTQEVQYDTSVYETNKHRQYQLDKLGLNLCLGKGRGREVYEKSFRFDPDILNTQGDATLIGYFQSEFYFGRVKDLILMEVFASLKLSEKAKQIACYIKWAGDNSVFIHIRRGDYLKEPHASYHGNLTMDYYKTAMALMKRKGPNTKFFVFSDDPDWCRHAFGITDMYREEQGIGYTIVEGTSEAEDLYLMAQCKDGIIANSSFSWWGGYLGPDQRGGVIVAPKQWFKADVDTTDLLPARWLKI